jgi:hypothetical protein
MRLWAGAFGPQASGCRRLRAWRRGIDAAGTPQVPGRFAGRGPLQISTKWLIAGNLGTCKVEADSHLRRQVSGMKRNHRADSAMARARQAAAHLKPVARSTSTAAKHRVRSARTWTAPRLERTGHLVADRIAPKISSVLSSAAQRIEPSKPRRRRWRKVAGASMATAAASAVAGAVLNRRLQNGVASDVEPDSYGEATGRSEDAET